MFRKLILFILLIFNCTGKLYAQQPWTLQQCIDQALKYNIQIKQSSLNNDLNKVQVTQNTAAMFPSINGSTSQTHFFGRSIDPYTNVYTNQEVRSNTFGLNGSLSLFEGFQVQNLLKESKLNYLSSQNDLKKIQNDISLNVVNYFLQVLFNDDLLKISRNQKDASLVQRDRMKRMYELGSVNKGNYLDLESQYSNDELKFIQAQTQYDQSLLLLTQLLELDSAKNFSIAKPDVIIPAFDSSNAKVDEIFAIALRSQPDIKSSDYKLSAAEKGLSVSRGALYPKLFLSGSINTNYSTSNVDRSFITYPPINSYFSGFTSNGDSVYTYVPNTSPVVSDIPFKTQFNDNLGKSVGFTLQVPVFNGWSARSNISRSKINLEQTRLSSELTRKTLYKNVQQAVFDVIASNKKFQAGQNAVDALSETFNYNQQKLDLGMINTYDYLISKNNLANAQASLLQAKYEYIFKIKVLDFYQGKPLSF